MDADKDLFDLLPGTGGVMLRFNGRIMQGEAGKAETCLLASNVASLFAVMLRVRYACVCEYVCVCLCVYQVELMMQRSLLDTSALC